MKRLGLALALCVFLCGQASAQLAGGLMFPGPGTPASTSTWTPASLTGLVAWYKADNDGTNVFTNTACTTASTNGLFKKTGNDALHEITGRDVVVGSHKAIGILVGVIYAEGNRMWLEKLSRAVETQKATDADSVQRRKKVKKGKKRGKRVDDGPGDASFPRLETTEGHAGQQEGQGSGQGPGQEVPESDSPAAPGATAGAAAAGVAIPVAPAAEGAREGSRAPLVGDGVRRVRPKSAPSQRISASQVRLWPAWKILSLAL